MSDLGTDIVVAVSRALSNTDLRYLKLRPLPAITASTVFLDLTARKRGSVVLKALAFSRRWYRNINLFPCWLSRIADSLRTD